jgi:hypothetical protein
MPLFQLCQNAGRRKPTQLKLSRNRHVRDYSREVGQHPVTARHANLTYNAQTVLLKSATRSRPQGRNGDYTFMWIARPWGVYRSESGQISQNETSGPRR